MLKLYHWNWSPAIAHLVKRWTPRRRCKNGRRILLSTWRDLVLGKIYRFHHVPPCFTPNLVVKYCKDHGYPVDFPWNQSIGSCSLWQSAVWCLVALNFIGFFTELSWRGRGSIFQTRDMNGLSLSGERWELGSSISRHHEILRGFCGLGALAGTSWGFSWILTRRQQHVPMHRQRRPLGVCQGKTGELRIMSWRLWYWLQDPQHKRGLCSFFVPERCWKTAPMRSIPFRRITLVQHVVVLCQRLKLHCGLGLGCVGPLFLCHLREPATGEWQVLPKVAGRVSAGWSSPGLPPSEHFGRSLLGKHRVPRALWCWIPDTSEVQRCRSRVLGKITGWAQQ